MRRQRNMAQMKEQIKTPEKELNKMEVSNLSDADFKTLFIRMLKELSENLSSIKKIQSQRDFFKKKKKIKTMNNKMAINTHQSTIESKKRTKQTRIKATESWIRRVLMVAR